MNAKYLISGLLSATLLFAGCEKEEKYGAPDKDKYIYDIPQTNLAEDAIVGAYYSRFSSAIDSSKSAEEPLLGYYSTTADVMAQHIEWADEGGVDFFIFTWDASSSDTSLISMFNNTRTADDNVKYVIRYNTSHLSVSNDTPLESEAKYKLFITDFIDGVADWMLSDNYYKIDGRPVMLITPANLSSSTTLSINFKKVMERFRADFRSFYGVEPYIIGEMTTGWVAPVNYADHQVYSFDGLSLRDWKTRSYDIFYGYFSFLDINMNNWQTTLAKRNVDFVPCIYPSFNDRVNTPNSYYYTFSEDGDTADYVNFCNVAKRNIGSRNIVLLNSWNNWTDGSNLEPSTLKDHRFLETTRKQFKK